MAQQTFTGRKRGRKFFGQLKEVTAMPNLIEVQMSSYDQFLMVDEPAGGRPDEGLQAVFKSVFPITDFANTSMLEFVRYEFDPPKYDVDECRQRGMTFAAPLKVTLRLIVFEVDQETGVCEGIVERSGEGENWPACSQEIPRQPNCRTPRYRATSRSTDDGRAAVLLQSDIATQ